ncbi:MAG: hypothetical protein LM571_00210 [Desulfurococcaceae archaeon]|nr:hypothetical protein [Desulfurococcaceae archaeon]
MLLICETLWIYSRRPVEVKAVELIRAATTACNSNRVRVVEEFSEGFLRVYIETYSKTSCSERLAALVKYVLGDDIRVIPSECGTVPL